LSPPTEKTKIKNFRKYFQKKKTYLGLSFLPTQLHVTLKLARIRSSDYDLLTCVTDHREITVCRVRVQPHDELEVSLFGVGLALFPHVVGGGLAEV
jgi:hypothetical protein